VVGGEFGGSTFGVLNLPPTGGSGNPTVENYVVTNIPATPDTNAWSFGDDPHTLTAYTSPNDGHSYAVFVDDAAGRTYLAIVDLTVLSEVASRTPQGSATTEVNALIGRLGAVPPPNGTTATTKTLVLTEADTCTAVSSGTSGTGGNPTTNCVVRFVGNSQADGGL